MSGCLSFRRSSNTASPIDWGAGGSMSRSPRRRRGGSPRPSSRRGRGSRSGYACGSGTRGGGRSMWGSTEKVVENEHEVELEGEGDPRATVRSRARGRQPLGGARIRVFGTDRLGSKPHARSHLPGDAGLSSGARILDAHGVPVPPAPQTRPFNLGPIVYVGPTAMLNFGKLWWATGLYLRANDAGTLANAHD